MATQSNTLEDHIRFFHEGCGGILLGEIPGPYSCAECGKHIDLVCKVLGPERIQASEPTRGAEAVCTCRYTENTSANFGGHRIDSTGCHVHAQPAARQSEPRVTRAMVLRVVMQELAEIQGPPSPVALQIVDAIMRLLEGK